MRSPHTDRLIDADHPRRLFNHTGSVLPAIVLHGGLTASQDHLVLLAEETHGVTDVAIGISYIVGVAVLLLVTGRRLGWGARTR